MESRREEIIDADAATCDWILNEGFSDDEMSSEYSFSESAPHNLNLLLFETKDGRTVARKKFISWLRTGSDVLHISGKAGSGKSTLMKYIGGHKRTKQELEDWAGDKKLIFGQFYFWISGSPSQRTLPGLYRSLLFQALSQCPDFIGTVFPSDRSVEKVEGFRDNQIRDAFELLLQQTQFEGYRLCFLIDGLDEFEGNSLEHENLAAKLKSWTAHGDVKLIVSSRPWREFHEIFTSNEPLHLHQLNSLDI
ncbi:hypothetical protein M406DRAFT_268843, partial [Cryphonectria parasitica EP155]